MLCQLSVVREAAERLVKISAPPTLIAVQDLLAASVCVS